MSRHRFFLNLAQYVLSTGLFSALPLNIFAKEKPSTPGVWIIDAHSHPYYFYRNLINPKAYTFGMIHEVGFVTT